MKSAVIVGRFQTDILHKGYLETFLKIQEENYTNLLIVVGTSVTRLEDDNPLPFSVVKQLLQFELENYPFEVNIVKLNDYESDEVWSKKLDDIINIFDLSEFDIIVGRDSFQKYYLGKYIDKFKILVDSIDDFSSTARRKYIGGDPSTLKFKSSFEAQVFARALIFASQYSYPRVYSTTDILVYSKDKKSILLGRKPNESFWRLIGGFVDPTDKSKILAGLRELYEEANIMEHEVKDAHMIHSQIIDDFRYRKSKNKIMTTLIMVDLKGDISYIPGDDIEELQWFQIKDLINTDIYPPHSEMLKKVIISERI